MFEIGRGAPALAYIDDSWLANFRDTSEASDPDQWLGAAAAVHLATCFVFQRGCFLFPSKCDVRPLAHAEVRRDQMQFAGSGTLAVEYMEPSADTSWFRITGTRELKIGSPTRPQSP